MSETYPAGIKDLYLSSSYGAKLLATLPIFKGFSPEELGRVYSLGDIRLFHTNVTVVVELENSSGLYAVLEGTVGVFKAGGPNHAGHRITSLGVGKSFGEMSLIDKKPRSATVVAETNVTLFYLDGAVWDQVLSDDVRTATRFYRNCSVNLAERLRRLDAEFILGQKQLWRAALEKKIS